MDIKKNKKSVTIACLGDSITDGVCCGVSKYNTFPEKLSKLLNNKDINSTMFNLGLPGEKSDFALNRINEVINLNPDFVTIMYGTNDAWIFSEGEDTQLSTFEYEQNIRAIIKKLQNKGIQPILMTPPPLGHFFDYDYEPYLSNGPNFLLQNYVEVCQKIALEEKLLFVDNYSIWQNIIEKGQNIEKLLVDGCHPNSKGQAMIAQAIFKIILPEIKEII
ncbi:MAG: hypothetical protein JEY97_07510 [Bacteroidales bacterium]|nr:hypothetical protein [Bacteroidales bacterium]